MEQIIVFFKPLIRGKIKTRLAVETNEETALMLYRAMLQDLETNLREVWEKVRPIADPNSGEGGYFWKPAGFQKGSDLGEKMYSALECSFARGVQKTLLIGSDIPHLQVHPLQRCLCALDDHDMVIGPAVDGGYYLIGFSAAGFKKATTPGPAGASLFEGLPWSTDMVFSITLQRARVKNLSIFVAESITDLDTLDDIIHVLSGPEAAVLPHLAAIALELELTHEQNKSCP